MPDPQPAPNADEALRDRLNQLAARIGERRATAQRQLSRLAALVPVLADDSQRQRAATALSALEARPPRTLVAGPLIDQLEREHDPWLQQLSVGQTLRGSATRGAGGFLALGLLLIALYEHFVPHHELESLVRHQSLPDHWALVGLAGGAGALVSLLTRWSPSDADRSRVARQHAALNGFLRPVIGWFSGSFVFFTYYSGLLSSTTMPAIEGCVAVAECPQAWATAYVLSFAAGFSERWVQDIAVRFAQDDADDPPAPVRPPDEPAPPA